VFIFLPVVAWHFHLFRVSMQCQADIGQRQSLETVSRCPGQSLGLGLLLLQLTCSLKAFRTRQSREGRG
jgi:hypothetical protein